MFWVHFLCTEWTTWCFASFLSLKEASFAYHRSTVWKSKYHFDHFVRCVYFDCCNEFLYAQMVKIKTFSTWQNDFVKIIETCMLWLDRTLSGIQRIATIIPISCNERFLCVLFACERKGEFKQSNVFKYYRFDFNQKNMFFKLIGCDCKYHMI